LDTDKVFRLSDDDYHMLLLALGYATGAAREQNRPCLARSFIRVANAITRDNPNWKPFEVADEPAMEGGSK
jgi:hypothetical protein